MEDILGFDSPEQLPTQEQSAEADAEELVTTESAEMRSGRFTIDKLIDPKKIANWMNKTRKMPIEAIDLVMVTNTYAAAVFEFRSAALNGHLNRAKSIELWLKWAAPIIQASKRDQKKPKESKGSVAFLPREPEKDE